ncbi:ribonuclease P protein subunit p30 [Nelusetta ayraudi]|uniref:ribonuclease P protein subunit p30 n=1 Tax=Nelusetta ayraudi TaxID=303726 RepID=UPI003F715C00
MAVFIDLNVIYTPEKSHLRSLIETAAHLGFSTIAINYVFDPSTKKKQELPSPLPIGDVMDKLPVVQGRSRPIRVLNRLTIMMSDASHIRPKPEDYGNFDLLAVHLSTEKLFHAACMTYDVDIICVPVTERLPFILKRAPVNGAIERGLVFEVTYAAAIRDSTMRRYTIANANIMMDICKGKNVILSSAAETALELRGPYDVTNLGLLFGLSDGDAKEAISSTCRSAVLHAETRRTVSGIVYAVRSSQQVAPPAADSESPPAKKARPDLILIDN